MLKRRNKRIDRLELELDRERRDAATKIALLTGKVSGLEQVEARLKAEIEDKNELLRKASTPSAVADRLSRLFLPPKAD